MQEVGAQVGEHPTADINNATVIETRRETCKSPNVQNIKKRGPDKAGAGDRMTVYTEIY